MKVFRVVIERDDDFDPEGMHPELIAEWRADKWTAHTVALKVPPTCGDLTHPWELVDSIGGVLLADYWVGDYDQEAMSKWQPGLDVETLEETINGMTERHLK